MTVDDADLRATLRALPVLAGAAPAFDPHRAPDDPVALFVEWLTAAIRMGVPEPHAMTLSTVDESGAPDARMLILKDAGPTGWHFAVSAASRKGAELGSNPVAALTFYWPMLVRQVRVRGPVVADPPDVTAADFLTRSAEARALALTLRQSQPLTDTADLDVAVAKTRAGLEADPALVPEQWTSYAVTPERVEFWQGDPHRRHQRLLYTADLGAPGGWSRTLLWP